MFINSNPIYTVNFSATDRYGNVYEYILVSNHLMDKNEIHNCNQQFLEFDLNTGEGYFIIPSKTYKEILKPVFNEIKLNNLKEDFKMNTNKIDLETFIPKSEINNWELTDDDCLQYLKEINPMEYECIQLAPYPIDDMDSEEDEDKEYYQVCQANVDIMYDIKTNPGKFISTLASYDYCDFPDDERFSTFEDANKIISHILDQYGLKGYQLIAECIFEDIPFFDIRIFTGSEEDCIAFIENYCNKH